MSKINYIVGELKIAQITSNSLLHEVEKKLKGREAFIDNESTDEKIYYGDVFQEILNESEIYPSSTISEKANAQIHELNDQTVNYNYIQIINA